WHVEPGLEDEPDVLYLGVAPACLFKSKDGGSTWSPNQAMMKHPTRKKWAPGAGGLCLHSIILREKNPKRMHVAISAVGTMATNDGGENWEFQNKNVRADFYPNKFPVFGQCVHKIVRNQARPNVIYQQNHCGQYRSDNDGKDWVDISEGLPSRFGFPIAVDANEPKRIYTTPLAGDFNRVPPKNHFAVWVSDDSGKSWEAKDKGLPNPSYFTTLREGMAADDADPCGVAVGTSTGHLFFSRNQGENWSTLADTLPPVLSVSASSM
ncbi:MAG TPA: sialidase family protein, partial [Nitrososphaerales archaeon]|nr:sialidase family protein [Nitrososphaerales archaeon]